MSVPTRTIKLRRVAKTDAARNLHDHIADRICRLADGMIRISARSIRRRWNISHTDLRLLNCMDGADEISVNELSRRAIVDQAWVSRSLKSLEQMRLVTRRADAKDSRRSLVSLTKKGKQTLEAVRPFAMRSEHVLLKEIDEATLKKLLDQLELNVEGMLLMLEHFVQTAAMDAETVRKTVKRRSNNARKRKAK